MPSPVPVEKEEEKEDSDELIESESEDEITPSPYDDHPTTGGELGREEGGDDEQEKDAYGGFNMNAYAREGHSSSFSWLLLTPSPPPSPPDSS